VIRVAPPDVGYVSKPRGSSGAAAHVEGSKHGRAIKETELHGSVSCGQSVVVGVETSGVGPRPDRVGGASRLKGMNLACDNRKALTNLKLASPSNWTKTTRKSGSWGGE